MIKNTVGGVYHDVHVLKTRMRTQIKNEKTFYASYCQPAQDCEPYLGRSSWYLLPEHIEFATIQRQTVY